MGGNRRSIAICFLLRAVMLQKSELLQRIQHAFPCKKCVKWLMGAQQQLSFYWVGFW